MENLSHLPLHNLGLYRLENFVGRTDELQQLRTWLNDSPVVAITGPSGAGKSTLATALAAQEAYRFEEGILWISATGDTAFDFYDIVRTIEDVLNTGITSQPVNDWPLFVLQQLYGSNRLLIMDELTEADASTVDKILDMIGQIRPGRRGRFILVGRSLPQRLLDIVGTAHLEIGGLEQEAVEAWVDKHKHSYPIIPHNTALLYQLAGGHPLALKMVAGLWESRDWGQLIDLVAVQDPDDWEARLNATVSAALATLRREYPQAATLLMRCIQASGGFDTQAIENLYWRNINSDISLEQTLQTLVKRGLLLYNHNDPRYFIHPLLRRHLTEASRFLTVSEKATQQIDVQAYVTYYLQVAQSLEQNQASSTHIIEQEWGNIRKSLNYLVDSLEAVLDMPVEQVLAVIDQLHLFPIPADFNEKLNLLKSYALTLRTHIISWHPPEGLRWLAAGIIASCYLEDDLAKALLGKRLAAIAHNQQEHATAVTWYQNSLTYFRSVDDHSRMIYILKNLADTLKTMMNWDEALAADNEALQIATRNNLVEEQAAIQTRIGTIYYGKEDYEQAVVWHKKALASDEAHDNKQWQARHHIQIGLALEANNEVAEAIEHYQSSAELYKEVNNRRGLSTAYGNLGAAYFVLGHPQESLDWYERDLAIVDSLGNWFDLAAILHNMGHVALELDNFQAAINYFGRSCDIYRQFGQHELADEEQLLIDTIQDRHVAIG